MIVPVFFLFACLRRVLDLKVFGGEVRMCCECGCGGCAWVVCGDEMGVGDVSVGGVVRVVKGELDMLINSSLLVRTNNSSSETLGN